MRCLSRLLLELVGNDVGLQGQLPPADQVLVTLEVSLVQLRLPLGQLLAPCRLRELAEDVCTHQGVGLAKLFLDNCTAEAPHNLPRDKPTLPKCTAHR